MVPTRLVGPKTLRSFVSALRPTDQNLFKTLEPGSEVLAGVQQSFHTMLDRRHREIYEPISLHCFYEEVGLPVIGPIVPMHSAILHGYGHKSIHANSYGYDQV